MQTEPAADWIKLDFEQARAKHLLFKSRLRSILYGVAVDEAPVVSHQECTLGKWIYGHALVTYAHVSEITQLEQIHAELHTVAGKLVALYHEGKVWEARNGLDDIERIAASLVEILTTIEANAQQRDTKSLINTITAETLDVSREEFYELQRLNNDLDRHIRKQSQELLEARERFELVAKATQDAVWDWDLTNNALWWNEGFCELFGYRKEEIEPTIDSWHNRIHPDDKTEVINSIKRVIDHKGKQWTAEYRFRKADGSYAIVCDRAYALYNSEGAPYRVVGSMQDISQRKRSEDALKQSEIRLLEKVAERTQELETQKALIATILESSMDGIYALKAIHDANGVITDFQYLFANTNIAKRLNREVDQIIGSSMLALIPENRTNGFFDLFCKLLQSGETLRGETHFVAQGINSWFDYVIVPIDTETVVVSTEDITEKKRAANQIEEQRNLLDNILKNSSNGISVSEVFRDASGQVVDALTILANDAAVKYIGLPKDVYLTKRATEIEPNIIGSPYYQSCIQTLQTGEPFMMQYLMESTGRWLELTVSKLDDNHLIHVFTDVTPIKEAQLQLERTVKELRRSNVNLEEFAYAASHDLKEPVRKVHFFSEKIKSTLHDRMTEGEKLSFERMELAAKRMNSLIDDLLSYSQISIRPSTFEAVNINQLIDLVLQDLDLEIEGKEATVTVDKLFTIQGHHRQLQQAFQNLISNALKYSRPGVSPQIKISWSKVRGSDTGMHLSVEEGQKTFYCITVQDNGIGFEQQDAERIFNVFTRLHGNAEYRGTGIGLSIVRKVVENHKGYIWAESTPGEGATFHLLLPVE